MAEKEVTLMKGNEAIAHAAIRCGADGYFGYPITPQSEVIETLAELKPWETTGMVVLQAESEVASINMIYGGAAAGKKVLTSSSSPGIALMQEGITYMAGAELPGVFVNVQRGGPGLGTIQPSQGDYFQATRGGGNGDYNVIVLAPNSVQEMADFVDLAFELAFKYRNPAMILADGVIGQMMEKIVLPPYKPRRTEEEIREQCPWATIGRTKDRKPNIITSLELKPEAMEARNLHLQAKYAEIREKEVRYETLYCEDAEYVPHVPHCLKKKAEPCDSTCSLMLTAHSGFIGLAFGPLSPPTITQSIPMRFRFSKFSINGSQDRNLTEASR